MDVKSLTLAYIGLLVASGLVGNVRRLRVAALSLASESIDSPNPARRWVDRYLFFSFWQLLASLFAAVLLLPAILALKAHGVPKDWLLGIYLVMCLPFAAIAFVLDLSFTRRCDARKAAARAALRNRVGSR